MKVLIINYEFPPLGGGTGIANYYLLREFTKEKNLQIDLLTSSLDRYREEIFSENIKIYYLDIGKEGKNPHHQSNKNLVTFFLKSTFWVLKNRSKYDFIHAFSGLPCGVTAWASGRPYLISLRGADVPGYDNSYQYIYTLFRPLIKLSWQKAKFIDANSYFLKNLVHKTYPQLSIKVIYNGVDSKRFFPAKKLVEKPVLVCNARLSHRKGIEYLISALPKIIEIFPESKLILIGNGQEKKHLGDLISKLGIKNHISFSGIIDHRLVPKIYRQAAIFILPSLIESLSNSLIEALACGLPVVASSVGGNKELVGKKNGILVPPKDSRALGQAIVKLLKDESLREKMGKESRKIAQKFSWQKTAKQYLDLYKKMR